MDNTWINFVGEDGINDIFDEVKNKSKKHIRDDALVPFKTKKDKNQYEDFSGVVGAFSRILSGTMTKKSLDIETIKKNMRKKMDDCSDEEFEVLFCIVENMYFDEKKLLPINIRALNYIDYNISQQQVAEYMFSLFVESTDLKNKLESIHRKSYPAYKSLRGSYTFGDFVLSIDHVQGDPFAAPSSLHVELSLVKAGFPEKYFTERHTKTALEDRILRRFSRELDQF